MNVEVHHSIAHHRFNGPFILVNFRSNEYCHDAGVASMTAYGSYRRRKLADGSLRHRDIASFNANFFHLRISTAPDRS